MPFLDAGKLLNVKQNLHYLSVFPRSVLEEQVNTSPCPDWNKHLFAELLVRDWLEKKWENPDGYLPVGLADRDAILQYFQDSKRFRDKLSYIEARPETRDYKSVLYHFRCRLLSFIDACGIVLYVSKYYKEVVPLPFKFVQQSILEHPTLRDISGKEVVDCEWRKLFEERCHALGISEYDVEFQCVLKPLVDEGLGGDSFLLTQLLLL